jgi:hypothetical protein
MPAAVHDANPTPPMTALELERCHVLLSSRAPF